MLVGNLVAILASGLVCIVVSLIKPDSYDWKSTREITMVDDAETGGARALLRVPMPQLAVELQRAIKCLPGSCLPFQQRKLQTHRSGRANHKGSNGGEHAACEIRHV